MAIDFTPERWQRLKANSRRWWAGQLERPLINIYSGSRQPDRPASALPGLDRRSLYDRSISPEAVVDRWDYELAHVEFLGDAFPCVWPDLGPGCIAAFMANGVAEPQADTVWFHPRHDLPIADLHFEFDPGNACFQHLLAVCQVAMDRWQGRVQVAMTDLGGNLDILSAFRPGEKLLLDLYDSPAEVQRLAWEAHHAWWQYYEAINAVLQPRNPGYTAWTQIFSDVPYYILQCDFCYMIGPKMFDEFVQPELAASCRRLGNAFYHLDGPGQLAHLDSLLSIPELKGVQWVPGTGRPEQAEWPEVLRRIRRSGKLLQIWGELSTLEKVDELLGSAAGVIFLTWVQPGEKPAVERLLRKYGAA